MNKKLIVLIVALECVFDVIIPFLMATLIDDGINKGDSSVIIKVGITLIICSILAMFCGVMSGGHAARASSGFAKNLLVDVLLILRHREKRTSDINCSQLTKRLKSIKFVIYCIQISPVRKWFFCISSAEQNSPHPVSGS